MKKLFILLVIMVLPVSSYAAQQMISSGAGIFWTDEKDKINENFTEVYTKDSTQDGLIAGMEDALTCSDTQIKKWTGGLWVCATDETGGAGTVEGTAVLSTGETGGVKFLREDGDGTSSWQVPSGSGAVDSVNGETGTVVLDASDIDIVDGGGLITATETDAALAENRTAINLNTAKTGVPSGTDGQMIQYSGTTPTATSSLSNIGFELISDETNLMWDGSDSYKVHLDGIFEPKDATILKDADIGSTVASDAADVNLWEDTLNDLTTAEADIQVFRVPTDVEWTAVYSECDDTSDVRLQPYISATRFGTYAAVTGSSPFDPTAAAPDMSGWTDLTAGDYVKLVITTPNTGAATECHTSFNLVNN